MSKHTYLVTAGVVIEIGSDTVMSDAEIEQEARRRFFAEIETYKKDEVRVDFFEEADNWN